MLIYDFRAIGNRLLAIRRRQGLTQAEVAEAAGLADRTGKYASGNHPAHLPGAAHHAG